jgi:hypothetical protein
MERLQRDQLAEHKGIEMAGATMVRPWRKRNRASIQSSPSRAKSSYLADALVVLIGFLSPFSVMIVGNLPVGELILIPIMPLLLVVRGRKAIDKQYMKLYILLALWLVGQFATDIYRQTERSAWMKGQANIIFFAIDLLSISMLTKGKSFRQGAFFLSFAVGSILAVIYQPSEIASAYPWKFGYSAPVTILLLMFGAFFYRMRAYPVVIFPITLLIFLNLILNYRSAVLFLVVTLFLTVPLIPEELGRVRLLPRAGTAARVVVLAFLAVSAGGLALYLVNLATQHGWAGEAAKTKNLEQKESRSGLLLGARPEILVSSRAVFDSPILGHGSWARDPKYIEMLYDIDIRNGIQMDLGDTEADARGLIPTHSHLMGAWVNAGIFGGLFWIYVFWIAIRATIQACIVRPPLSPLFVWLLTWFLWAIWFSPFGSTARITEAATITIIFDLLERTRTRSWRSVLTPKPKWRRMGNARYLNALQN